MMELLLFAIPDVPKLETTPGVPHTPRPQKMPRGEPTTLVFQVKSVNHTITLFRSRSQALQGAGLVTK